MNNKECVIANVKLRSFSFFIIHLTLSIICLFLLSCNRSAGNSDKSYIETSALVTWSGALPAAILQTGEHPLWFQLTEDGPVHIQSIEEAADKNALVPWPYALYIFNVTEKEGALFMAVNRGGFLKLEKYERDGVSGLALYSFSGGRFWNQYTVGGFIFYNDNPAALLYPDERFIDTYNNNSAPALTRIWSFNMNSNVPYPADIPVLNLFPDNEGWIIDTLRHADDGYFYFRAYRNDRQEIKMLRARDPGGNVITEITADVFFGSAPRVTEIINPRLPQLPENFIYTGIGNTADSIFASWEEQADYSIGAAGFVVIKN